MLGGVFGAERIFISTKMAPGTPWFDKLLHEISETVVGIFVLTPDALESRWLPYECGQFLSTRDADALIPFCVGVSQPLLDARVPVLQRHHANHFGEQDSFVLLSRACARRLDDASDSSATDERANAAWRDNAAEIQTLLHAVAAVLPNSYTGTTRYSRLIADSNFQMPQVFECVESRLFLVGINHAYALNIERDSTNFLRLAEVLLATDKKRKARFMISDMWNPAVFECYQNLTYGPFARAEVASFTRIYKQPGGRGSLEHLVRTELGKPALDRLVGQGLLEIRLFPSILDTFWFVDDCKCQFSLANGDGQGRPVFYCGTGSDEAPEVFKYYHGLATTAFSQAVRLWPPGA
jgi:hypothetical protein